MRRSTMTTPAAAALLVLVLPAAALAGVVAVDHGPDEGRLLVDGVEADATSVLAGRWSRG